MFALHAADCSAVHSSSIHRVLRLEFAILLVSLSGLMLNVAIDSIIYRLVQLAVPHWVSRMHFFIISVIVVITNVSLHRTDSNNKLK